MSAELVVSVGGERYTLAVENVLEVTRAQAVTPVPGAPSTILGVQNLRGQLLPVLDLGALLGHAPRTDAPCSVVVERPPIRVGFAVDAALELLDGGTRLPMPGSRLVPDAALVDGAPLGRIDVDAILSDVTGSVAA